MRALVVVVLCTSGPARADDLPFAQAGLGVVSGYHPQLTAVTIEGTLGVLMPENSKDRVDGGGLHALAAFGSGELSAFSQVRIGLEGYTCIGGGFWCAWACPRLAVHQHLNAA